MTEKVQKLSKDLREGKTIVGACSSFLDSSITELLADIGYDFVWIDAEHSSLDKKEIQYHIMATRGTTAASFVRIPWNDPVLVKPILDMDPDGVIFPLIKNQRDAERAVSSCLYPPEGIRGFGPRRADNYGTVESTAYVQTASAQFWRIVQIEHIEAVENLGEILTTPGIDAAIVGPNDLAASIGYLGQPHHAEVKKVMDQIGETAAQHRTPLGAVVGNDPRVAQEWLKRGARLLRVGTDISLIRSAAANILATTRGIAEGPGKPE